MADYFSSVYLYFRNKTAAEIANNKNGSLFISANKLFFFTICGIKKHTFNPDILRQIRNKTVLILNKSFKLFKIYIFINAFLKLLNNNPVRFSEIL